MNFVSQTTVTIVVSSKFDTQSNNSSKQVVAASDASLTLNGVQVTRSSNTITDLVDGYEFKLNSTTASAVSIWPVQIQIQHL